MACNTLTTSMLKNPSTAPSTENLKPLANHWSTGICYLECGFSSPRESLCSLLFVL